MEKDVFDKVIEEVKSLEKVMEEKFINKNFLENTLSNYTTKEDIEKLRTDIANIINIQSQKQITDYKKDMHEYLKKALTSLWVGPYMIPTEVSDIIFTLANVYGIARKISNVFTINSKSVNLPTEVDVSAYWVSEALDIVESGTPSGGATATLQKLAGYSELSLELVKYSTPKIVDHLLNVFSKAISKKEDLAFLVDTEPFNGIVNRTPNTSTVLGTGKTHFSDITLDDVISLINSNTDISVLESADAVLIMRPEVWNVITTAKDSNGNYQIGKFVDFNNRTIAGRKVYLTNLLPGEGAGKVAVIFGDFKQSNAFVVGSDLTMETSLDYGFKKNVLAVRVLEEVSPINLLSNKTWSYIKLGA